MSAIALIAGLGLFAPLFSASSKEAKAFDARPGDTVIIQVDYGRVRVNSWKESTIQAEIERVASQQSQLGNIEVIAHKQGDKIHARAFFYDYAGESVNLDVWAPPFLNVVIWGANPAVSVSGMDGYVRVHSLSGSVTGEDLTGSVSLIADRGDILYRARRQPTSDVRLDAVKGNIRCELQSDLNFRGWARAGRKLQWNGEVEMGQGALERQVGLGGPLCLASSIAGDVSFSMPAQLPLAPSAPPAEAPEQTSSDAGRPTTGGDAAARPDSDSPPVMVPPGTGSDGSEAGGYKVRVNVEWIYLNASVRERNSNRSVPDLRKEDFQVYEDGVRQTVGRFSASESPFHLLLLLDVSGSTQEYLDLIKEASIEFTREIGRDDRIALATFNSSLRLRQDFTNDRNVVIDEIRRIRSGGGTAFYDALMGCVRDHTNRIEGRKAIVVFTDGVDNQLEGDQSAGSTTRFSDLYREIQDSEALIYTIFLDTAATGGVYGGRRQGSVIDILEDIMRGRAPSTRGPRGGGSRSGRAGIEEARTQLESIAEQTGARMYSPNRIDDLSNAYKEIADDLRVQYTLGYNSSNGVKDGQWRRIKVSISNRPELEVRTRKGYYAGEGAKSARVSKNDFDK